MAIKIEKTKRIFQLTKSGKVIELSDPNPKLSIDEVSDFYSSKFPELLNSIHETKEKNGDLIISFKTVAGTKG